MNGHGLVAMHPAHLRLTNIGRYPNVIERNNGKELFARLHRAPTSMVLSSTTPEAGATMWV